MSKSFHVAVCVGSSNGHLPLRNVKSLIFGLVCVEFMYATSMTLLLLALLFILCAEYNLRTFLGGAVSILAVAL